MDKSMMVPEKQTSEQADLNPFGMLDSLRELRLSPFGGFLEDILSPLRTSSPAAWMPRTDIRETEKEYIIDISLPGVKKEDVKVEVKDDVLTVAGEKNCEKEEKGKNWLRRESSYGSFVRSFAMPEGLHTEDVKASCKDGVLTLTVRKPVEIKRRGVSIKVD